MRIVSTVPSQTELLWALGLDEEVVGVTAYCVHPKDWREKKTVIGGTKDLKIDTIRDLQADLLIGNKEENIKEQVEQLAGNMETYISEIEDVSDALKMISELGELVGKQQEAQALIREIEELRQELARYPKLGKALYFIWKDPYMVAGQETFIGKMLELAGFENAAPDGKERYPSLSAEEIAAIGADYLLLSSEPYSFSSGDLHQIGSKVPRAKMLLVDGEYFSWYGSRMVQALRYLIKCRKAQVW